MNKRKRSLTASAKKGVYKESLIFYVQMKPFQSFTCICIGWFLNSAVVPCTNKVTGILIIKTLRLIDCEKDKFVDRCRDGLTGK